MATTKPKLLTGADRKKFLALSDACANRDQLARIKARLRMNEFVAEHTHEVCQATFDAIMKRNKK